MSGSVRARVTRSLGATTFGLGVVTLTQLVGVPLFLHAFGVEVYGEWLVLSAVPAYLSLSDLGFVGVAGNEMTMRAAVGDHRGALAAFQTVWAVMTVLSTAATVLLLLPVWLLAPERLLHLTMMTHREVALTLTLLVGNVLLSLHMGMLEAGFRCIGRFPRGTAGIALVRLFAFVAAAAAAVAGAGPVGAAAAQLVASAAGFVVLRTLLKADAEWLLFGFASFSRRLARALITPALAFLCFPIGNALALQGMVFVVSAELAAAQVVVLNVVRVVATSIRQLVNVINHAVWPELSRAIAADELPLARRLHVNALRGSVIVTILVAAVLAIVGQPFIGFWTHSAVAPADGFMRLMILTVVLDSAWLTSSVVLASVNRHQKTAALYALSSATAVGLAAVLVPRVGLDGVPVALMVSDVVLTGYVVRASTRILMQPVRDFGRQLVMLSGARGAAL